MNKIISYKNNKVSIIGIGKLGLPFALLLERNGYDVLGNDIIEQYIRSLNDKSFKSNEPYVSKLLIQSKRFQATTNIKKTINHSDIIFLFLATPSLSDGRYDHQQIDNVISKIINIGKQKKQKYLIISCTVMPGFSDSIKERLKKLGYIISYNPEFIAQGNIVDELQNPDIVLIGEGSTEAGEIIFNIYKNILLNKPSVHRMSPKEAEITKISLNCYLTTKIAFANMIGDIAIRSGCDENKILSAIGSDTRIGRKFLHYGYGFGGPCLPRDNRALSAFASDVNIDALISMASDRANIKHLDNQVEEFIKINDNQKEVIINDPSYKSGTNIIEESQQLAFAVKIANKGYKVKIKGSTSLLNEIRILYKDLFVYELS